MAAALRTANYGSEWTQNDLLAYKIAIDVIPAADFFGSEPDTDLGEVLDPSVLNHTFCGSMDDVPNASFCLVQYMDSASQIGPDNLKQQFAVDNFSRTLLHALGFQSHLAALISRPPRSFEIAGFTLTAHADLYLTHEETDATLLIVKYANAAETHTEPEPGIISAAIAAFQENTRVHALLGRPALDEMVFPCVVMAGTRPTFYKIPVTAALSAAVAAGTYPETVTCVTKCVVPSSRPYEGMENKLFRAVALRYFIALKALLGSLWSSY